MLTKFIVGIAACIGAGTGGYFAVTDCSSCKGSVSTPEAKASCCGTGAVCCDPPQACCFDATAKVSTKTTASCCSPAATCCDPVQECCLIGGVVGGSKTGK